MKKIIVILFLFSMLHSMQDSNYTTDLLPILQAAKAGDKSAYVLLSGNEINKQYPDGMTNLHWAVLLADSNLIDHLLSHGAEWNIKDTRNTTARDLMRRSADEVIREIAERIEAA